MHVSDDVTSCVYVFLASNLNIGLEVDTYTVMEADLMQEVCVSVDGNVLPSGRVVQYRIQTVDQTAIGIYK